MEGDFCLTSAPVATDFEDAHDAASPDVINAARNPKLGVLALAAVLDRTGKRPILFDLDKAYLNYLANLPSSGLSAFPGWVAEEIAATGARLFGFSSICNSYPVTLRVAEAVKRNVPGATILLGGPQASVVDRATLNAFTFVDFILRGEADLSLPVFLDAWRGSLPFAAVPGLTYRSPFGIQRNADAPVVENLDELPLPAYHLTDELSGADQASLELGRGCPFSCTFCSTNDFFRRRFRLKSPQRMLADMRAIAERYGIRKFDLVHDMFTVDRKRVIAFCEEMIESEEGFEWACSARTDCVDGELLELMARAGCYGVFFGVEAGSQRMQQIIDKGLELTQSKRAIAAAERFGIGTTVSLIAGFPEETEADLEGTVDMYLYSLRHLQSSPQLNILAPLAGTPVHAQYREHMVLRELCSDASHQGRMQNDEDRRLIQKHPDIFPNFYLLPTPGLDHASLLELREFLLMASERLRWLMVCLHRQNGVLGMFYAWRERRGTLHPGMAGWRMRHYYMSERARVEFIQFADTWLATRNQGPPDAGVSGLLGYYKALIAGDPKTFAPPETTISEGRIMGDDIPVRDDDIRVLELDCDIQEIIDSLKRDEPFTGEPRRKCYRTESSDGVRQLVEITPLAGRALSLCDGRYTVNELISALENHLEWAGRRLRRYAGITLLESLRAERLIAIRRFDRQTSRPRRAPSPRSNEISLSSD